MQRNHKHNFRKRDEGNDQRDAKNYRRHDRHHRDQRPNHHHHNYNYRRLERNVERSNSQKPFHGADLPRDIICHICYRLPIKSVLRFRAVSKSWLHILKRDSFFINLQCNYALRDQSNSFVLSRRQISPSHGLTAFYFVEKRNHQWDVVKVPFEHEVLGKLYLEVVATCEGLLCLAGKYNPSLTYIYNPISRESQSIPPFDPFISARTFLGFDAKTNKYKLLKMYNDYPDNLVGYIITLGESSWRKLDISGEVGPLSIYKTPKSVCFSGEFYWITEEIGRSFDRVLAMDIHNERFRIINFPNTAVQIKFCFTNVIVYEKYLTFVAIDEIWDENWHGKWKVHLWHLVNSKEGIWGNRKTYDGIFNCDQVWVLGTVDDDSLLLSTWHSDKSQYNLIVYSPATGKKAYILAGAISGNFSMFPLVPSLLPPP